MSPAYSSSSLAFVVVNFGSSSLLAQNLVPAAEECRPDLVIVVDCWSSENERQRVTELASTEGWHVAALAENRGFGGGMNVGAALARSHGATHLLLLNPDARIGADAVQMLRRRIDDDPFTLVAPRVVDGRGRTWFDGAVVHLHDGTTSSRHSSRMLGADDAWEWISGACMMLSMNLWDAVGGFDDSYFLYWEDVDLSKRVTTAGGKLVVIPEATAIHDEGGTHTDRAHGRGKSATYYRYNIRNRLLFATKHLGAEDIRRWRRGAWRNAWAILMEGGRRQLLHPVAPVSAAWQGLREGRALAAKALKAEGPGNTHDRN